jgi:CrcB protein
VRNSLFFHDLGRLFDRKIGSSQQDAVFRNRFMQNVLLVAIGGAVGASSRYLVALAAGRFLDTAFPWGTLIVNLVGCFVMGLVGQWLLGIEAETAIVQGSSSGLPPPVAGSLTSAAAVRHLVAIGFLGGLTTFSAFGWDTLRELESGRTSIALANIAANVLLSLLAVWCGATLMKAIA